MTNTGRFAVAMTMAAFLFGQSKPARSSYKVLAPTTQDNLTIFPIVAEFISNTHDFLTLDEGLRSGQVMVTEQGGPTEVEIAAIAYNTVPTPNSIWAATGTYTVKLTVNGGAPVVGVPVKLATGGATVTVM